MSFATLLLKKAVLNSSLTDERKVSLVRIIGVVGRVWIMITAIFGIMDFFADFSTMPPRIVLAIIPSTIFLIWLMRSKLIKDLLPTFPILPLYFLQIFRVAVELELYELWKAQLVPQSMTFSGRNFDIVVGATAPIVGWLVYRSRALPTSVAVAWNILGILILSNVVVTGVLSTPSPMRVFHEDFPNSAVGIFPYVWLPTILVPIAYGLHIIAIRHYFATKNSK